VGGQPWSFENGAQGEPSHGPGDEWCAEAFDDGVNAGWNNYLCDSSWVTTGFVCEFG
jgi:hypothetical protein